MINLFQFWNNPTAPDEVEALMETWKQAPGFTYHRYNTETAAAFITQHFDVRTLAAFRKCKVPAMQADFFRYCALYVEGGVWVDADTASLGLLADYLDPRQRGLLMMRQTRVANDFLFVSQPKDALFARVIENAVQNVEQGISNNVWLVTGPGIMTKLHENEETRGLFDGYQMRSVLEVREKLRFQQEMEYKKTDDDWRSNLEGNAPSIFN